LNRAGNVRYDTFAAGFADWEVQLGLNIGDYAWFILKSKVKAADIRLLNLAFGTPDWIGQNAFNKASYANSADW
jgi:hypothetical protein